MKTLLTLIASAAVLIPLTTKVIPAGLDTLLSAPEVHVSSTVFSMKKVGEKLTADELTKVYSKDGKILPRDQWAAVLQSGRYDLVTVAP